MKKKALILSYGSHFIVLFGIIVIMTFARSDFDFILTGAVTAAYTAGLCNSLFRRSLLSA